MPKHNRAPATAAEIEGCNRIIRRNRVKMELDGLLINRVTELGKLKNRIIHNRENLALILAQNGEEITDLEADGETIIVTTTLHNI